MLGLLVFVYMHWQARVRQTTRQNHETNTTETKRVIFQQWCEVHPIFMCNQNYSNVYKEMKLHA